MAQPFFQLAAGEGSGSTLLTTPSLPRGDVNLFLHLVRFLREALSEDGQGSWSRVGSAVVVGALVYVMITTHSIPERTEELAWVLAALYGANQIARLGETVAQIRKKERASGDG